MTLALSPFWAPANWATDGHIAVVLAASHAAAVEAFERAGVETSKPWLHTTVQRLSSPDVLAQIDMDDPPSGILRISRSTTPTSYDRFITRGLTHVVIEEMMDEGYDVS